MFEWNFCNLIWEGVSECAITALCWLLQLLASVLLSALEMETRLKWRLTKKQGPEEPIVYFSFEQSPLNVRLGIDLSNQG